MVDFRTRPIERPRLAHTGRLDGDDTGYRDVRVDDSDALDPDPMVAVPESLARLPVYSTGAPPRVSTYYPSGIGAAPAMFVRGPAARALLEAERVVERYGRHLLVLDAWRPAAVQARLWSVVFERLVRAQGLITRDLSPAEWLRLGRAADDVASYCRVVEDGAFQHAVGLLLDGAWVPPEGGGDAARQIVTFQANYGVLPLCLDHHANTAHGSGGACDLVALDEDGPVNFGVPFDSPSPAAVIDWFEHHSAEEYADLAASDPDLRGYLAAFGVQVEAIDAALIVSIRTERRIIFHAMRTVGATFYSLGKDAGEAWHFNLGNERGGRHAQRLPSAGNACHSLLKDVRDPRRGDVVAAWGNATAHRQMARV